MTTDELKAYYRDLLIVQYRGKPKARATIEALVKLAIMDQLPLAVQDAFSVDSAIGIQLDILAKYVGVTRNANTFSGPVILDDSDFRTLIKLKIVQNNAGSSLYDIQKLLDDFLTGAFLVFDFKNMHMGYFFNSEFGSEELAEVFVNQGLLPKPMGVQLATLIYSANITNFFGFRTYEREAFNVSPFNSYSDYQMDRPWLSYDNAITG